MAQRIVPERFLDVGEEPDQTLAPIEGYENAPLVSLEEAVQPIESSLHNIESMVKTAKRNSRKPADGLTSDESAAIQLYTMEWPGSYPSLYSVLNQRLRSKHRKKLTQWFLFLKLFLTALYKLPSFKGVVWRGVPGNLSDQYDEDHIWWGASSCTLTTKATEAFLGDAEGPRTIFNIECLNGKSIQAHSYVQEENEILLMPGSYFHVVSKMSPGKGVYIIHLQEKTPPYQTIALPFNLTLSSISTEKKSKSNSNTASAKSHVSNTTNTRFTTDILKDLCLFDPIKSSSLCRLPHDCYMIAVECLTDSKHLDQMKKLVQDKEDPYTNEEATNSIFRKMETEEMEFFLEYVTMEQTVDSRGHYFVCEDRFNSTLFDMVEKKASYKKLLAACRRYETISGVDVNKVMAEHEMRTEHSSRYFTEKGLSVDDAQGAALAVAFYTGSKTEAVSRGASLVARHANGQFIEEEIKEAMNEAAIILFYLVKALSYIPYYWGYVTRVCQLTYDELKLYMPGCLITWIQFSSSIKGKRTANFSFASRNTIFKIYSLTGRPINQFSHYPEEDEVLFLPHSTFFVFKHEVGLDGTQHTIYMRQVELGLSEWSILWVDANIFDENWENKAFMESTSAKASNLNVHFISKSSTESALSFLRSPFGERLKNKNTFRIVTSMNRINENPSRNAGARLIKQVRQLGFKNECLVFTNDKEKAEDILESELNSNELKSIQVITRASRLRNFISFEQ